MDIFITGTNRGLGYEFTKQYLEEGHTILAACRNPVNATALQKLNNRYPDQLHLIPLDLSKRETIKAAGHTAANLVSKIDLLINNAGMGTRGIDESRKEALTQLDHLDDEILLEMIRANAVGPMILIGELHELIRKGHQPKIINISSEAGSIGLREKGSSYGYSGSKCLMNMFTRLTALDLTAENIIVAALSPGWVQTDMGGPQATFTPEESVAHLTDLIGRLGKVQSGRFFDLRGKELPW